MNDDSQNQNSDVGDDELLKNARRLATGIRPRRDLWPEIATAIAQEQRRPGIRWFAQAAAVLLLVAGTAGLTWYATNDKAPVIHAVQPELVFELTAFGPHHELEQDVLNVRRALATNLDTSLQGVSAEEREDIETSLVVMRDAIQNISFELEKDPDNVYLQEMLRRAYRDELNLMRRVSKLTRNVMLRNDI